MPLLEKPELELDIEMLKRFIKYNVHQEADIIINNGKIFVVLPLDILFKYSVSGDRVRIQLTR